MRTENETVPNTEAQPPQSAQPNAVATESRQPTEAPTEQPRTLTEVDSEPYIPASQIQSVVRRLKRAKTKKAKTTKVAVKAKKFSHQIKAVKKPAYVVRGMVFRDLDKRLPAMRRLKVLSVVNGTANCLVVIGPRGKFENSTKKTTVSVKSLLSYRFIISG